MSDLVQLLGALETRVRELAAEETAAQTRINALLEIERELRERRLPYLQDDVVKSEQIAALKRQAKEFGES